MNAKKIMGAVLVALLAAALFVGAGAAANPVDGTVFTNQKLVKNDYGVNWIGANGVFTPLADPLDPNYVYFPAGSEGVYTYQKDTDTKITITVAAPKVTISAVAGTGIYAYSFIDGTYYTGTDAVVDITYPAGITAIPSIYITTPDVADVKVSGSTLTEVEEAIVGWFDDEDDSLGEYSLVAVFQESDFVNGTLYDHLITKPVSFKVAEAGSATIATSVDQALKTDGIKVTITGQPGMFYEVSYDNEAFYGLGNQMGLPGVTEAITGDGFVFRMPNTGSVNFVVNGGDEADDSEKMTVVKVADAQGTAVEGAKKASVTVKFLKGTITAEADADSYFIGDEVTITGVNKAGTITAMTLKGTNFYNESVIDVVEWEKTGENFEFTFDTSDIINDKPGFSGKKLDVGAYTLTIVVGNVEEPDAKATVVVSLKQPFISIVEAPEVIVQDTKAEFIVNAEATTKIRYYIFGTNYFNASADVTDLVEDTTNQFTFTLNEAFTEAMDAGQYFMVIQHPMYNGVFDIAADGTTIELDDTPLFNVDLRQTANAAQALCDALDTQNIDDMYVKYSFFVVGEDESFTMSEIPTTIAQGETLTISGVSTANAGEFVTVEMISTAFAAVPKETVGSAAFIAVTTQIADDGTWEVTFDTSDLNVDEYSLKVACTGQEKPWKNVEINVVEAADKPDTPDTPDVPEQPENPTEPEAPETPGFGALAALAGLGAVAVLLLRRE